MAESTEQEIALEEIEPKKKKKKAEEKQIDLGPLLMAALAILLLAFFILLVSMATVDSNKRKIVLNPSRDHSVFSRAAHLWPLARVSPRADLSRSRCTS